MNINKKFNIPYSQVASKKRNTNFHYSVNNNNGTGIWNLQLYRV